MHPDAEWIVDSDRPPLRGHEEIAAFVTAELARLGPEVPEALPTSMTQHGDVVLVYGAAPDPALRRPPLRRDAAGRLGLRDLRRPRREGHDVQLLGRRPATAAGIAPGTPPTRRFRNWQLAIGLGRRPAAGLT